jgi:aryl-alcohol dehydrogenase-like predicted oxidoreductase
MQYKYLGKTGMKVSRLCLGTMNFGPSTEEKEAYRIMDAAIDAGVNFFDTANVYGGEEHRGWTEEIIGRWFQLGGGRREKVILATKVYGNMEHPIVDPNERGGLSAYKIRRHLEGSLRRLKTDHIELYQMHHVDRNVSWEELWNAFDVHLKSGKIGYVGASNFAGRDLVKAQYEAKMRGMQGLVSEQHKYSLLCRLPELEVLPAAEEHGIGVIAWSPLDGGILGGNLNPQPGSRSAKQLSRIEALRPQLERFSKLCAEIGESEATVALAWTLVHPAMTGPIIGPRTLQQFEETLHFVDVKLSDDVLAKIDEIFPGPGGDAPKAYAW